MASNPFQRKERDLERKLRRLERAHDKGGEPLRKFNDAKSDIAELLFEKKIDKEHAEYLFERAEAAYNKDRIKHKLSDKARMFRIAQKQTKQQMLWIVPLFLGLILIFFLMIVGLVS